MATNASALDLDAVDIVNNGTTSTTTDSASLLSSEYLSLLLLEAQLVFSALAIIYVGAHASLQRPPYAAPARKRKSRHGKKTSADQERQMQGLLPSDAIVFPVLAGTLLVGLYYLIQYLQDPAILNKIMRWYLSGISIVSLVGLYAHGIDVATSFVFPRFWRSRGGVLHKVDQRARLVWPCDDVGNKVGEEAISRSPLPGVAGWLVPVAKWQQAAWSIRAFLTRQWVVRCSASGTIIHEGNFKASHVLSIVLSIITAVAYWTTSSTTLSNILGYAMCYGSLLLISPTDFLTSCLILSGLFVYDIVMVFYTPYMVTVATTLDVPIKLTFKVASRQSILGLGDIVIPGMVVTWTLRYDLARFYFAKIKSEPTEMTVVRTDDTGTKVETQEAKQLQILTPYVNAKGTWGEQVWVRGLSGFIPLLPRRRQVPPELAAAEFPKVYFSAAMVGYSLGMLATLTMLLVFERGQPALLYLVPCMLGAVALTAVARGEWKQLWNFTEDGSLDVRDRVYDVNDQEQMVLIGRLKDGVLDLTKEKPEVSAPSVPKEKDAVDGSGKDSASISDTQVAEASEASEKHREVLSFVIELPSDDDEAL